MPQLCCLLTPGYVVPLAVLFTDTCYMLPFAYGCLESVEWNDGMEHWNGILEWVQKLFKAITMKQMHYT